MNSSIEKLQQILFELSGVLPEDSQSLFALTKLVILETNQKYIRTGDTSRKLAYIEHGLIRVFTTKTNSNEATLFVRWEGQFFASHESIIFGKPSNYVYLALEPTTLIEIDYDSLEEVLHSNPKYEPLRNFFLMEMLGESLKKIESFVLQSPEERYKELMTDHFDIVNRVPDKYIASMLGITPVSLSRIRKRMYKK